MTHIRFFCYLFNGYETMIRGCELYVTTYKNANVISASFYNLFSLKKLRTESKQKVVLPERPSPQAPKESAHHAKSNKPSKQKAAASYSRPKKTPSPAPQRRPQLRPGTKLASASGQDHHKHSPHNKNPWA